MTKTDTMPLARDLWLRSTDEKGAVTRSFHRVWDADRFIAARQEDAAKLNAKKASTLARPPSSKRCPPNAMPTLKVA